MADMILRLRNWASPRRMGVLRPGIMGVPPSLLYFFFLLIFIMSFFRNTSRACVSNPDSRNNPRQKYMYLSRHLYLMALLFIFPIFVSGSALSLSHASSSLPDYLTPIVRACFQHLWRRSKGIRGQHVSILPYLLLPVTVHHSSALAMTRQWLTSIFP